MKSEKLVVKQYFSGKGKNWKVPLLLLLAWRQLDGVRPAAAEIVLMLAER